MYIIFPTLTGFAFLAIYVLLVEIGGLGFWPTGFVLIVIYSVLFDINHFFSTYTRTVFDKSFIQENQAWFNHGLAVWLTKRVSSFLLVGAAFGLVFEMGRTGSSYWLPTDWIVTKNLVVIFFASLVLHHYYLDAVIWKLRKHKELRESI